MQIVYFYGRFAFSMTSLLTQILCVNVSIRPAQAVISSRINQGFVLTWHLFFAINKIFSLREPYLGR